eukprot:CAMPEP_0172164132 /NCGR_PEP_ID=MMETSP1050-20130122/7673_1 /TAXON_ID=233186 /ORGANISM="Cryptomonas curvata, Strain CCAP979/52" /LENGTH=188 /DNA_ID=CAMNT_0012834431 /DNA_START=6 /DNA_END=572 /DNA_ORIENTATION=+
MAGKRAIQSPAQSALLAAAGVAPPPPIVVGSATVPNLVTATEYKRSLKRQKLLDVPTATSGDLANAKSGGGSALAQIMAELKNLNSKFRNSKIGFVAGGVLQTMVKATAGHPAGLPTDPALVALGPAPVSVGTALPPAAIMAGLPWTRGRVASLTAAQLNDLEWFYNEQFVGQTVSDRRIAFLAFLGT